MSYTVPLRINGHEFYTETTFDVEDPSTGMLLWKSSTASTKEVVEAIDAAEAAFTHWANTKPAAKRDIFIRAADIFEQRANEFASIVKSETGCDDYYATMVCASLALGSIRDVAGRIVNITSIVPTMRDEDTQAIVYKEPYGVVLAIAPWNAPFILGVRSIIFPLATGNAVILKGSELSPRSFLFIVSVFEEAGLPNGVLNFLTCRPQDAPVITKTLIEHTAVRKVNFTGSTKVGKIIATMCGQHVKPCLLELGGKAGAIVLDDADIENAALHCSIGAFTYAGQVCMSTERLIVHKAIAPTFSKALVASIENVFAAHNPAPILISSPATERAYKLVRDAVSKGAKILVGDINSKEEPSNHMRPIVVEGVNDSMDIYREESFGPSVSLIIVEDEEEAIRVANDTEYGLSAAVFTRSLETGLRVAKKIESGAVHINRMTIFDDPSVPHGGVKSSGFGRFNAEMGLEEFLKTKAVTWASTSL